MYFLMVITQFFLTVLFILCKSRQENSFEFRSVTNLLSKQKKPIYKKNLQSVKLLKQVHFFHGTLVVAQQAKVNLVGARKTQ